MMTVVKCDPCKEGYLVTLQGEVQNPKTVEEILALYNGLQTEQERQFAIMSYRHEERQRWQHTVVFTITVPLGTKYPIRVKTEKKDGFYVSYLVPD